MPRAVDLTGLSIEAAMEVAERDMDRTVSDGLDHLNRWEQTLRDFGAGSEQFYDKLERERADLIAWREQSLAELRTWLERDCTTLH